MRKLLLSSAVALGSLALITPLARAALLASETFDDDSVGTLHGATGGSGWNTQAQVHGINAPTGWQTQNANTASPGYDVKAPGTALTYLTLQSGPNYAIGGGPAGDNFITTGRMLDVSSGGAFNSYLNGGGNVGLSGTTLYMSLLMREDKTPGSDGGMHVTLMVASTNVAWWDSSSTNGTQVQIGDFGSGIWSLNINGIGNAGPPTGTLVSSGVSITQGTTYLMVLKLQFNGGGNADVASLWVDPASLGGADPGSPTASGVGAFTLDSLAYYGGNQNSESSIDEIRFGSAWADVTPTGAVTAVPLPSAAWSALGLLGCLAVTSIFRRGAAL